MYDGFYTILTITSYLQLNVAMIVIAERKMKHQRLTLKVSLVLLTTCMLWLDAARQDY